MKLDHAHMVMAREGESCSGDAVLVQMGTDATLFAVVDALGHGEVAARVAERGIKRLTELPPGIGAAAALEALDRHLHGTRGAAATICTVHKQQVELAGLGNVNCRTLGGSMPFVPKPGIVGGARKMPPAIRFELKVGQRLILHSDGVSHRFDLRSLVGMSPEEACSWILRYHRHSHDDASVLVIDARGSLEVG